MMRLCAVFAAAAVLATAAGADDKKDEKKDHPLKGSWVREVDGSSITMNFKTKTELVVSLDGGAGKVAVTCSYTVDKDGVVKGKISKIDGDLEGGPPEGFEFKFKFKVDGEKATLSDFEAQNGEGPAAVLEGEYSKKKSD